MQPVKFRVWNVRRFLKEDEVAILPSGKLIFLVKDGESESEYREMEFLDVKVSFFTGLKDKNGVEIYEGDIIKDSFGDRIGRIRYNIHLASFEISDYDGIHLLTSHNSERLFEVIGNVYEHPHLLEANT